jgi:prepilin-type N-terminal cleavage/methylation domain-containing protein
MMYFTPDKTSNTGFSLVETLVAIAILLIVIVGPMSIATSAANSTSFANQQVMAYFLAQEGLELVQKGRDDFLLARFEAGGVEGTNIAWDAFTDDGGQFADCLTANNPSRACGLEIGDGADGNVVVTNCVNAINCQLYLTSDTSKRSRYTHDITADITDYTRIITIEEISSNKDVLVTSVVSWRTGNQIAVQSTTATTYLYNIYGR